MTKKVATQIVVIVSAFLLSACSSKSGLSPTPELAEVTQLPEVDTSTPEPFIERFKPHGFEAIGPWMDPFERGAFFQPVQRTHPESAVVYIYRPESRWASAETMPASIFLNGQRLRSLKNNHYYFVELPAGTYRLAVRRPLPPVYFQKGTVVDFRVEAGQDYYLKYAEQYHISPPDPALGLLYARPIIQMPTKDGLAEIASTRAKTTGYRFVSNPNAKPALVLAPVSGAQPHAVAAESLSSEAENRPQVKFKIYNPLTW